MYFITQALILVNLAVGIRLFFIKRKEQSPFQFFYLALIGVVIWPSFFDPLNTFIDVHVFSNAVFLDVYGLLKIQLVVLGYLMCFTLLESLIPNPKLAGVDLATNNIGLFYVAPAGLLVLFLLGMRNFESVSSLSFQDLRQGSFSFYYIATSYLSMLSLFLSPYLVFIKKKFVWGGVALVAYALVYMTIGGSRQPLIISCFILAILALEKTRRPSIYILFVFVVGFSTIDYVLMLAKYIRNAPGYEARVDLLFDLVSGRVALENTSSEAGIRLFFYKLLLEPGAESFGRFSYLLRSCLFWYPSFLDFLSIKPADFERDIFEHVMPGKTGTTHATYFGNTFADSGYCFPVWVLFSVAMMRSIEWLIVKTRSPFVFWCLGIYCSVMLARGALYAVMVVMFLAFLIEVLDRKLRSGVGFKRRRERTRSQQKHHEPALRLQ